MQVREVFASEVVALAKEREDILLVSCDLTTPTGFQIFADSFPQRTYQVGIAEANAIGIAAGLALSGYRPVVSSFAAFLTGKNVEIRQSIALNDAPALLVGTHSGPVGPDGASQAGTQDLAVMASIPGIAVYQPSDSASASAVVTEAYLSNRPAYFRVSRHNFIEVPGSTTVTTAPYVIRHGRDVTIVTSGYLVGESLEAARQVSDHLSVGVVAVPRIKPLHVGEVMSAIGNQGNLVVLEDHAPHGGLHTVILSLLNQARWGGAMHHWALDDQFVEGGPVRELLHHHGLTSEAIASRLVSTFQTSR